MNSHSMEDFLKKIADALEAPGLKETDDLTALPQWDSLAILSLIAMFDANYGVNLPASEIQKAGTGVELWNLVQASGRK
jgi:acyl carrier protein